MLCIVQSIPSPKAEPVKQWLAHVETERLEEVAEQDILAGMSEDQWCLYLRDELVERNKQLAATAQNASVITGKTAANQTHFEVGRVVRKTITELGGTMPENPPAPPDSIEQVRQREQKRIESERWPPMLD